MSSMLYSQGMVLATAMAVSGTIILLAFRLQKSLPSSLLPPMEQLPHLSSHQQHQHQVLRSCISSTEGKKKKKKKRVHFAEDVMDPRGDGKEFRRQHGGAIFAANNSSSPTKFKTRGAVVGSKESGMPANRVALYNGILRDRVIHRLAYSC